MRTRIAAHISMTRSVGRKTHRPKLDRLAQTIQHLQAADREVDEGQVSGVGFH